MGIFIVEGALILAGPLGKRLMGILQTARDVFDQIVADPIVFLKNLVAALVGGFDAFKDHIGEHLKNGLLGWLTGALGPVNITMPKSLDPRGILHLAMEVAGLTYVTLRRALVTTLGERRVALIEKSVSFLRLVATGGLAAAWRKIVEYVGDLAGMVMEKLRDWVITKVVTAAMAKIALMFNPVGAILQVALAIFRAIQSLIERAQQIMAVVEGVFASIHNIAAGTLGPAILLVESTMARMVPVIISFLANQVGLGGIAETVTGIIKQVRAKVEAALTRVAKLVVALTRRLVGAVKSGATALVAWWKRNLPFTTPSGEKHELAIANGSRGAEVTCASEVPIGVRARIAAARKEGNTSPKLAEAETTLDQIDTLTASKDTSGSGKLIDEKLAKLKTLIIAGKLPIDKEHKALPLTKVTWKMDGDRAGTVTACPLTILPGNTAGSGPTIDHVPAWKQVVANDEQYTDEKGINRPRYWVRMHLLNDHLHGPGDQVWNLTPGHKQTNSWMLNTMEADAKTEQEAGNILFYQTTVRYPASRKPPWKNDVPDSIVMTRRTMTRQEWEGCWNPETQKLKDGPSKPVSVTCPKDKLFPPPDLGIAAVELSVLSLANPCSNLLTDETAARRLAKAALQTVPGVGELRAEAILAAQPTNEKELRAVTDPTSKSVFPGPTIDAILKRVTAPAPGELLFSFHPKSQHKGGESAP
jgi:hypothetical protein